MQIVQIQNAELIKEFITEPRLYDRLREDHSPAPEHWMPNLMLSIWAMVFELREDETADIWGMFAYAPETPVVYRFHPAISPHHWGDKQNVEAGKLAVDWFWQHSDAAKLVGKVPTLYPDLMKWGQRIGFSREGVQRNSFLKNGELHDQYHMGINREK